MDNTCAFVIFFVLVHSAQSEEERVRDQKEREELEQHLRDRDTARTRKVCLSLILGMFLLFCALNKSCFCSQPGAKYCQQLCTSY